MRGYNRSTREFEGLTCDLEWGKGNGQREGRRLTEIESHSFLTACASAAEQLQCEHFCSLAEVLSLSSLPPSLSLSLSLTTQPTAGGKNEKSQPNNGKRGRARERKRGRTV